MAGTHNFEGSILRVARRRRLNVMFANASQIVVGNSMFNDIHGDLHLNRVSRGLSGLQILNQDIVSGARHNSSERFPPPNAILKPDVDSNRPTSILWLNGPAGAGKSSITQTIAERCTESSHLAASFFFSQSSPVHNSTRQIFATIAYQLAFAFQSLKQIIKELVEDDPLIINKSMDLQFSQLILGPMELVKQSESKVVIIDGLDECEDPDIQAYIIQLIGQACDQRLPVCFLIASQPEPHIQDFSTSPSAQMTTSSVPTTWPSHADISTLVERSSGQFIYAATVVKFVGERGHRPTERLKIILDMSLPAKASGAFAELDCLYSQILSSSADIALTLRVLGTWMALPSTLSCRVSFLEDLLLQRGDVYLALSSLHSLLRVPDPEQHHQDIAVYHKSFFDFLIDYQRSKCFFIDVSASHAHLARCCLRTLTNALKDEGQTGTKTMLSTTVSYAYCHWCFHCTQANPDSELLEDLHRVDIFGLDSRRIFPRAAVTFLLNFPGVQSSTRQ
ncbi:hypothetical protein K443DRAFT_8717 [Laccaria amethystina LaAM-08-1]|uniref:Nephrocystin 3-like N-terminal domain-containing protein n=1 Tax=Laccaria amethystina LaAM-08-1 TaxID=1095629 RepID=A0A0C9XT47_9AGAR|nr:hypothetical protein K443DRAFT_8717 [Laccaria amethystina LaAM-08-1]